ncbi:xanthine dehydrogenase accessory protein XdhC [Celeribacter halophilus]|uniref:xanthine dehydrogenase accessory protein XdhC n=1 Tax=Celeribacter halophilus TaxID=576117 RepID=UPI001C0979EB|nr:xanthine dehydrogenase accessory protein XdhC [Celeribacter halophilus]MBU2891650.1 xanthine dehydrogenase accessory protein XdhC [Celeribacter halophilus]MDO6509808.1 xanthine dehydrogenase accessory protein XdhC [Celeribacter halophilus]
MSFDREALCAAIATHGRVARVVVAEVQGSAPREVGAAMLVWQTNNGPAQSGTIGGGTLEYEAARHAFTAPRLQRLPLGPAMGQCCGGAVTLLTEVFEDAEDIPEDIFARGPGPMPFAVKKALTEARAQGVVTPKLYGAWMVEPVTRATRPIWVWGAGHVGRAIVTTLAPLPELAITWADTAAARFPDHIPDGVTRLVAARPDTLVPYAPPEAEHLILTYSHALDLELCHRVLSHGFAFAGLIGSRTKWARFRNRLRDLGHTNAQIDRICCPIGQPDLGKHPQAIAVGVAAQVISRREITESYGERTG